MTRNTTGLGARLQAVLCDIRAAELKFDRPPGSVELLAVSKTHPVEAIRELAARGQRAFGENYLQETLPKMAALADLPLVWHFIGPIQSNKTRAIAEHFDWVHSVDRMRVAERLSLQRPPALPPLNLCLQVNIDAEPTKAGVAPEALWALAQAVVCLPRLRLRGLMVIPTPGPEPAAQRAPFCRLRVLYDACLARGFSLDTLSMGMTADMEAAIAEGATIVRIGTALFGPRGGQSDRIIASSMTTESTPHAGE